ncbi:MAG TPA: CoA transferase [Terriglobia bacterium]|nr:CoA transferase [Terriglobia bacterium]
METTGLLAPYRVLDLTDESGFSCGKILADLGADVIKIEPPGGDAARFIGPFPGDRPDPGKSLYFISYNARKRGITLNLESHRGRDLFKRLAERADFLIETYPPGTLERLGLSFGTLRRQNPRLILVSITPFGQTGPYRDYKGSDLVTMAMSGLMSLIGEAGRMPLRVSLPQSPMWAGMYAAAGALTAHYFREAGNRGQHVDVSMQSSLLWALANGPAFWSTNRAVPTRGGSSVTGRSLTGARMRAIYECKDGYLNFIIYGGKAGRRSNQALVEWIAERGLATESLLNKDWNRFSIETSTQAEIDEIEGPTAKLFLQYTKSEFLEQAFKREMLGYPVSNARDILDDPHLKDREFWQSVDESVAGAPLKFPGVYARFSESGLPAFRPAPRLGQHNIEIYQGEFGLTEAEIASLREEKVL